MLPILGVHGVNTVHPYGDTWADVLSTRGLDAVVVEGRWDSRGSFYEDVRGLLFDKAFREAAIRSVADAVLDFTRTYKGGALLGHSAGQPLLFAALRLLALNGHHVYTTVVTTGGPMTHKVWKNGLAMVGFGPPPGRRPRHLFNPEDPVCCFRPFGRFGITHPTWMEGIYTPVAGRANVEHNVLDYLDSDQAVRALTEK